MSFSFGNQPGFAFGQTPQQQQPQQQQQPPPPPQQQQQQQQQQQPQHQQQQQTQQLPFGNPSSTSMGFSFGGAAPVNTLSFGSNPNTGFTFIKSGTDAAPAAAAAPGFGYSTQSFGNAAATQTSNITSTPGSLFGISNTLPTFAGQQSSGFTFAGSTAPAVTSAPIFPSTSFTSGFVQSSAPSATNPQPQSAFSFGGGNTFGFGLSTGTSAPSNTTVSSFGFAAPTMTNTSTSAAPSFGLSSVSAPTTTQSFGLNFSSTTPAVIAPITTVATDSGFSFGNAANIGSNASASIITAPSAASQPFTFSSLNAPATTTGGNISFGIVTTNTAIPTPTPPLLGFNQSNVFAVGGNTSTTTTSTSSITFKPMQTPITTSTTAFQLGGATPVTSTSAVSTTSSFSGFAIPKLGTSTTTSVPVVSTSGFNFGAITTAVATSTTTSAFTFPKSTTTSSIFGPSTTTAVTTVGSVPSLTVTTSTITPAVTTTGSSLFPLVGTSLTSSLPGLTTTTATITTAPSGVTAMNFRQLEESINKWTLELEEQEKVYLNQATQVNAWDRLLIKNGEKITQLNDALEKVKIDQQRLDHEIDFILAQQRELEELLVPLETSLEQAPSATVQQHADLEREHTYHLAENIDVQLKRMAEDLKEIIDHVNASNNTQDNTDPIYQVGKILNAHLDSLQWIDQNTALVQRKLEEVSQLYEVRRKDQERRFRLAYD